MAENTLLHDTLLEYINANARISPVHLTYNNGSMGSNALRQAVSHFLNRHFLPFRPVEPRHVLITNGCSSAIEQQTWSFLNPGDAILLSKPYYSTFIADITLRPEAVVIPVEMGALDPLSPDSVSAYETAASELESRTGRRTINRLLQLCQARQMHLISDEIYALSVWQNRVDTDARSTPFGSLLSRDPTGLIDPDLVHVLWGMSKDFGANGLRVGAVISQSNPDLHVSQKCLLLYVFLSAMSDQITAAIFSDDANGIEYSAGCNAGFFVWVDLGKKYLELYLEQKGQGKLTGEFTDMLFQRLLRHKVYVAHGTAYGAVDPGWFRLVFAHPLPWLDEAMVRIIHSLSTVHNLYT
ncbi:pyridoxal phosphate-dependent transferase [Aspergillus aurantiobrunneus]